MDGTGVIFVKTRHGEIVVMMSNDELMREAPALEREHGQITQTVADGPDEGSLVCATARH